MNRIHIPKVDDAHETIEGSTYIRNATPDHASYWCMHEGEVYMHCVGVYGLSALTLHSIGTNGEVNASVLSKDGTGNEYHEFVILDDWDPCYEKNAGERYVYGVT